MGEFRLEHQAENDPVSTMVLSEVADQANVDPVDLAPRLATVVDTDALEALFTSDSRGYTGVKFRYAGHRITIHSDEVVQVNAEQMTLSERD